jgi:hypothetical protein
MDPLTQLIFSKCEQMIQSAVEKKMGSLAQEARGGNYIKPLHIKASKEARDLIEGGKFIDMATLLPEDEPKEDPITFSIAASGSLVPSRVPKAQRTNLTIEQWSTAFTIFISVMVEKKQELIQPLLGYYDLIRSAALHFQGTGWRTYDSEFRRQMAADKSLKWDEFDTPLWSKHIKNQVAPPTPNPKNPAEPQPTNQAGRSQPTTTSATARRSASATTSRRHCRYFQSPRGCKKDHCEYRHKCSLCESSYHGQHACRGGFRQLSDQRTGSYNTFSRQQDPQTRSRGYNGTLASNNQNPQQHH